MPDYKVGDEVTVYWTGSAEPGVIYKIGFEARATANLIKRHEDKIRENAARIQEHIGYVIDRVDGGHAASVELYARDVARGAQEILARVAALEAIKDLTGIQDSSPAPSPDREG